MGHGVVPFVARVLEHLIAVVPRQRNVHRPRPGEAFRIFERHLVVDLVRSDARVALGQPLGLPAASVRTGRLLVAPRLVREIRHLDDQGVPLPVPPRIAHPLPDGLLDVGTSIQWNDADVVNHLVQNRDVPGCLKNLIGVVVAERHHDGRHALGDTPIPQIEIEPGGHALAETLRFPLLGSLPEVGGQGNLAVRWIHHQRRPPGCLPPFIPVLGPVAGVVGRKRAPIGLVVARGLLRLLVASGKLLVGQEHSGAELRRPFHGHADIVVARVHALNIRVPPGRARDGPGSLAFARGTSPLPR